MWTARVLLAFACLIGPSLLLAAVSVVVSVLCSDDVAIPLLGHVFSVTMTTQYFVCDCVCLCVCVYMYFHIYVHRGIFIALKCFIFSDV